MIESEQFLLNIKLSLSRLNQCRLVKIDDKKFKSKYLNTWPLYYDNKNIEVIDYLKGIGIHQKKAPFVKVFDVPYDVYDKSEKIDEGEPLILKLAFLRNYIEVRRLELQNCNEMEVSIAYDPELTNEIDLPQSTDDYQAIEKLAKHTDVLFAFNLDSFLTKVNGYTGMFVLNELKLFPNIKIKHIHRKTLMSSKVKKGNRAIRVITDDIKSFKNVINLTEQNIKKSMKLEHWSNDLERLTMAYELDKKNQKSTI